MKAVCSALKSQVQVVNWVYIEGWDCHTRVSAVSGEYQAAIRVETKNPSQVPPMIFSI